MGIGETLQAKLGLDLSDFQKGLRRAASDAKRVGARMAKSFSVMRRAAKAVAVAVLAIGAATVGLGALAVREFVLWEAAMTGVAKTVDASVEQIAELGNSFRELSEMIPVAAVELANIGEIAGQLGVEVPNILKFTEVIAALAVSTNLSAEAAAVGLARFANVMGTSQDQFGRLGSVIVDLGNNLETTEAEILSFGTRMAGAGRIAGLTEGAVLAIAGAMSSVGIEAEAGGTAVQKVLIQITTAVQESGEELAAFAKVAGQSASDFAEAWTKDAGSAFTDFIEGVGKSGQRAALVLGDLGIVNERSVRAFISLAGAGDKMREALDIQSGAWIENTALTEEAARFYDRTGARLVELQNKLKNTAAEIGENLTPIVEVGIRIMAGFLDTVAETGPQIEAMANAIADALPGVIESVVRGVGRMGSALVEAINIISGLQFAAGLGLVGLIFLGPQGAAALGSIGFVIDALIEKLGGPVTVADALREKLDDAIDKQARLLRVFESGGRFNELEFVQPGDIRVFEEVEELGRVILGLKGAIKNLTPEDLAPVGNAFAQWVVRLDEAFLAMQEFKMELGSVGREIADGPIGGESAIESQARLNDEWAETIRLIANIKPLLGPVPFAIQEAIDAAAEWNLQLDRIAETVENQIIGGIAEIALGFDGLIGTIKSIGRAIFREIVANLIKAQIAGQALGGVLSAAGGLGLAFGAFGLISQFFDQGGIVKGSGEQPVIAHGGEVVLSRDAVSRLGGAQAANQLNSGSFGSDFFAPPPAMATPVAAATGGSQNVMIEFRMSDVPEPTDFGIMATRPQIARLFSEMLKNHRRNGGS